MQNNVVTLETAKKLKAAGFPQETVMSWIDWPNVDINEPMLRSQAPTVEMMPKWEPRPGYVFAAPTATEIYLASGRDSHCNYAMPEAAAAAWLSLHESFKEQEDTNVQS